MAVIPKLERVFKRLLKWGNDKSPQLLTFGVCVGTIATAVMSATAAVQAYKEIEEERKARIDDALAHCENLPEYRCAKTEEEKDVIFEQYYVPLTRMDCVKMGAKYFIGTAVSVVTTSGFAWKAERIQTTRLRTEIERSNLIAQGASIYQRKVIEQLGEKKEREIRAEAAREHMKQRPLTDEQFSLSMDPTCNWFFDPKTGQWWVSTIEKVKRSFINMNTQVRQGGQDWYPLTDVLFDAGADNAELAYKYGFSSSATGFGCDPVDVDHLLVPDIQERNGHEVSVICLDYDVDERELY